MKKTDSFGGVMPENLNSALCPVKSFEKYLGSYIQTKMLCDRD